MLVTDCQRVSPVMVASHILSEIECHLSQILVTECPRVSPVTVACHRLSESVTCHSCLSQIVRAVICEQRAGTSLEWSAPLWERLRLTALLRTGEKLTFCHQAVHCHSKEKKWFENLTLLNCYNINEKVKSVKKGSIIWYRTHQSLSMECTKQSIFESLSSMLTRTGLIRGRTPNYNSPALPHFHKRDGYPDLQKMSKT